MKYEIELSRVAFKSMAKIPKKDLKRIQGKIDDLAANPRPSDVKKIQGDSNLYRIRSGDYRVLYRIYDDKIYILVVNIEHRKDVYSSL